MCAQFKHTLLFRSIAIAVITAFIAMIPAQSGYAQVVMQMPAPGQMVHQTGRFDPALMAGLRVDLKDPFNFYFIMDRGEKEMADDVKKEEYSKLIKYFLSSLTTANTDMWVNLSPVESDRIIPDNFGKTGMGRDLLAQDYILKQFTASLMYPEDAAGKKFWKTLYEEAYAKYGTTDIPVDTFNKVWITADKAQIYQKEDTAFLVDSHLKVMLEQDFKLIEQNQDQFGSATANIDDQGTPETRKLASDIVREVIVPLIEKEVNEGESFASVRQAYSAMIMATWFKKTLKQTLLGQAYADKNKVAGIENNDPQAKEKIYQQYLEAYKVGVFNYIKEETDPVTQESIPRKYFSGGLTIDPEKVTTDASEGLAKRAIEFMKSRLQVAAVLLAFTAAGNSYAAQAVNTLPEKQATAIERTVSTARPTGIATNEVSLAQEGWGNMGAGGKKLLDPVIGLGQLGLGAGQVVVAGGIWFVEGTGEVLGQGASLVYQNGKLLYGKATVVASAGASAVVQLADGTWGVITSVGGGAWTIAKGAWGMGKDGVVFVVTATGDVLSWTAEQVVSLGGVIREGATGGLKQSGNKMLEKKGWGRLWAWPLGVVASGVGSVTDGVTDLGAGALNFTGLTSFETHAKVAEKLRLAELASVAEAARADATAVERARADENLQAARAEFAAEMAAEKARFEEIVESANSDWDLLNKVLEETRADAKSDWDALMVLYKNEQGKNVTAADFVASLEAERDALKSQLAAAKAVVPAVDKVVETTQAVSATNDVKVAAASLAPGAPVLTQKEHQKAFNTVRDWVAKNGSWLTRATFALGGLLALRLLFGISKRIAEKAAAAEAAHKKAEAKLQEEIIKFQKAAEKAEEKRKEVIKGVEGLDKGGKATTEITPDTEKVATDKTPTQEVAKKTRAQILQERIEQTQTELEKTVNAIDEIRGKIPRASDRENEDNLKYRGNLPKGQNYPSRPEINNLKKQRSALIRQQKGLEKKLEALKQALTEPEKVALENTGVVAAKPVVAFQAKTWSDVTLTDLNEVMPLFWGEQLEKVWGIFIQNEKFNSLANFKAGVELYNEQNVRFDSLSDAEKVAVKELKDVLDLITDTVNEMQKEQEELVVDSLNLEAAAALKDARADLLASLANRPEPTEVTEEKTEVTAAPTVDEVKAMEAFTGVVDKMLDRVNENVPTGITRTQTEDDGYFAAVSLVSGNLGTGKVSLKDTEALLKTPPEATLIEEKITLYNGDVIPSDKPITLSKDYRTGYQKAMGEIKKALADARDTSAVGGIDLGDEYLKMEIKVSDDGMPLPVEMQDPAMINLDGLSPIIREISPITPQNVPVLSALMQMAGSTV